MIHLLLSINLSLSITRSPYLLALLTRSPYSLPFFLPTRYVANQRARLGREGLGGKPGRKKRREEKSPSFLSFSIPFQIPFPILSLFLPSFHPSFLPPFLSFSNCLLLNPLFLSSFHPSILLSIILLLFLSSAYR